MFKLGKKIDEDTFWFNQYIIHAALDGMYYVFKSENDYNKWFKTHENYLFSSYYLYELFKYLN